MKNRIILEVEDLNVSSEDLKILLRDALGEFSSARDRPASAYVATRYRGSGENEVWMRKKALEVEGRIATARALSLATATLEIQFVEE